MLRICLLKINIKGEKRGKTKGTELPSPPSKKKKWCLKMMLRVKNWTCCTEIFSNASCVSLVTPLCGKNFIAALIQSVFKMFHARFIHWAKGSVMWYKLSYCPMYFSSELQVSSAVLLDYPVACSWQMLTFKKPFTLSISVLKNNLSHLT